MEIVLNRRLIPGYAKRFEFVEKEATHAKEEPGLKEFLRHLAVDGGATGEEIEFLKSLKLNGKHPTPLYYYRELQNLRDPLHFSEASVTMHKRRDAGDLDKQMHLDSRKKAIQQWANNKTIHRKKRKS